MVFRKGTGRISHVHENSEVGQVITLAYSASLVSLSNSTAFLRPVSSITSMRLFYRYTLLYVLQIYLVLYSTGIFCFFILQIYSALYNTDMLCSTFYRYNLPYILHIYSVLYFTNMLCSIFYRYTLF